MGGQFGANGAMMANAPIERGADLRDGRESDEAEQYRDGDSQHSEDLFSALPLEPVRGAMVPLRRMFPICSNLSRPEMAHDLRVDFSVLLR